ncbi:MAG TPA: hypothetical protein VGJ84_04975 [Polyangiaceae bacterium]
MKAGLSGTGKSVWCTAYFPMEGDRARLGATIANFRAVLETQMPR